MLILNNLRDKPRSRKVYKRVGRGKHNSPGHGGKGQTARTGVALGNFQGGQTPIERRLPKLGTFYTTPKMATVSLEAIDRLIDNGHISINTNIDFDLLRKFKIIKKAKKFKVVGKCHNQFTVICNAISSGAQTSILKTNGKNRIIAKAIGE